MTTEVIAAIAGSAALSGVAGAFITGLFNKKRLGADTTKVITDAAAGVVSMLREDNAEKDRKVAECLAKEEALEKRVGELEDTLAYERSAQQSVNQMHVAWDYMAYLELQEHGTKLPAAPPLYPPPASRIRPRGSSH